MKINEVPQDDKSTVQSRKIYYAMDDNGEFVRVESEGWEPGYRVMIDVRDEFDEQAALALERVRSNQTSPLEYFMYRAYLELPTLAKMTGFSRRTVRRHFRPEVFQKLDDDTLQRYATALRTDIKSIKDCKG